MDQVGLSFRELQKILSQSFPERPASPRQGYTTDNLDFDPRPPLLDNLSALRISLDNNLIVVSNLLILFNPSQIE